MSLEEELFAVNSDLVVLARERQRLVRRLEAQAEELRLAIAERDRALAERDQAHWRLRRLGEVFPTCMDCGEVRGAEGWKRFTDYLYESGIPVSHGLCPTCAGVRMAELDTPEESAGDSGDR